MTAPVPLRNIAIIAHVDHGKTTLVDAMLRVTHAFRTNQKVVECVMDSNDLERERGITIFSKNASIVYKGVKINLVDTPGHADFGGEVERILKMVDGVLLLVDAYEGPMPQTRFVLKKALANGLKAIVVINKIDRPEARPHDVLNEIFDLFVEQEASNEQLDFPVVYTSGRQGVSKRELEHPDGDMSSLLDTILEHVPPPSVDETKPLQVLVSNIDYNDYVGRIGIGRVTCGRAVLNQPVALLKRDGSRRMARIEGLEWFVNIKRERTEVLRAGDIGAFIGIEEVDIGDTLADPERGVALPPMTIDEPTLSMVFSVNDSPLAGREGKYLTSRHLRDRLFKELRSNVALRVELIPGVTDGFKVSGRGLLHLSILIENMRREGYELQVSKPEVIFHGEGEKRQEPVEFLTADVPQEHSGRVIEQIGSRRGVMRSMITRRGIVHFEFDIPSRGLIGLRSRLLSATRGEAIVHHVFSQYEEYKGPISQRQAGVLVSMNAGTVTSYAIDNLQDRGSFFVEAGDEIYEGMVVGEHCHEEDIAVNACRKRHLTNIRSAGADFASIPTPPRIFALEEALEYISENELVEVTPTRIRMRKKILSSLERRRIWREARRGDLEEAEAGGEERGGD